MHAVAADDVEGGQFWGPRYAAKGEPRLATPTRTSRIPRIGARVWAFAEQAVGVRFDAEAVVVIRGAVGRWWSQPRTRLRIARVW